MAIFVSDILGYARNLAQTDSNGLTDAVGLTFLNDGLQAMTREMIARNVNAAQIGEQTASLVSGVGSFTLPTNPSSVFALKTISVNYTGSNQQDYLQATHFDVANIQGNTSPDYVRVNQPTNAPLFTSYGNTIEVFPTPTANNAVGAKIIYFKTPTEYNTGTASVIGYPQTLDYRLLSCYVAMMYADSLRKFDLAAEMEKKYKERLETLITILAPGSKQPIEPQGLQVTGWDL